MYGLYLFASQGETNRAIAAHTLNKMSSRSHCIFTIYMEVNHFIPSGASPSVNMSDFTRLQEA